jgi:hypothetical protein
MGWIKNHAAKLKRGLLRSPFWVSTIVRSYLPAGFLAVFSSFFTGLAAAPQPPHPHFSAIFHSPLVLFCIWVLI